MHVATQSGNMAVMQLLLDADADVWAQNAFGWTPLHFAVSLSTHDGEAAQALEMLLAADTLAGAAVGTHANSAGCRRHSARIEAGLTALHLAAETGCAGSIQQLLAAGADVNANASFEGGSGYTALHAAAERGHKDAMQTLLQAGASLSSNSRIIIEYGGYVHIKGAGTPWHAAAAHGRSSAVAMVLEWGADVGSIDGWHSTGLAASVRHRNVPAVQELLAAGASYEAAVSRMPEDRGFLQNAVDDTWDSELSYAVVDLLLKHWPAEPMSRSFLPAAREVLSRDEELGSQDCCGCGPAGPGWQPCDYCTSHLEMLRKLLALAAQHDPAATAAALQEAERKAGFLLRMVCSRAYWMLGCRAV